MKTQKILSFPISLVCASLSLIFLYAYVETEEAMQCTIFISPLLQFYRLFLWLGASFFSLFAIIMFIVWILEIRKNETD